MGKFCVERGGSVAGLPMLTEREEIPLEGSVRLLRGPFLRDAICASTCELQLPMMDSQNKPFRSMIGSIDGLAVSPSYTTCTIAVSSFGCYGLIIHRQIVDRRLR